MGRGWLTSFPSFSQFIPASAPLPGGVEKKMFAEPTGKCGKVFFFLLKIFHYLHRYTGCVLKLLLWSGMNKSKSSLNKKSFLFRFPREYYCLINNFWGIKIFNLLRRKTIESRSLISNNIILHVNYFFL